MSIDVRKLTHIYMPNTPFESVAIKDIDWTINDGEFWGLLVIRFGTSFFSFFRLPT